MLNTASTPITKMAPIRGVDPHTIPGANRFQVGACRRTSWTGICLLCVRGLEPRPFGRRIRHRRERRSLALTLYQADFAVNHVINVMEHEHPSLFSFAYPARGLIVRQFQLSMAARRMYSMVVEVRFELTRFTTMHFEGIASTNSAIRPLVVPP